MIRFVFNTSIELWQNNFTGMKSNDQNDLKTKMGTDIRKYSLLCELRSKVTWKGDFMEKMVSVLILQYFGY